MWRKLHLIGDGEVLNSMYDNGLGCNPHDEREGIRSVNAHLQSSNAFTTVRVTHELNFCISSLFK